MLAVAGILLTFVISAAALRNLTSTLGPVVNLGYAAYAGNTTAPSGALNGPVTFFGGIPYAQPPLGDLRFKAPQSLDESYDGEGTTTVTDARNWGPPCLQQPAQVGVGIEDCLTLNIWTPNGAKEGDNLPVQFWIHGGGFFENLPAGFPLYQLANQSESKIVIVSAAYRLNLLGFLASDAITADGGSANRGLLDQRAAMEWVQRHISSFGGDPDNVTIDGESAGGASVIMHMLSYGGTKPVPFVRAIAQSIGFGPTPTKDQSEATFQTVLDVAGCKNDTSAMACLNNASIGALTAAINAIEENVFMPTIDDDFLPDLPSTLIASGNFSAIDFVGGHCADDGSIFVGGTPDQFVTDQDVMDIVFVKWGDGVTNATRQAALALYPAPNTTDSPYATQYDRAVAIAGDVVFTCMDWFMADAQKQKGTENVFTFKFNAPNSYLYEQTPYLGTMHTSDLFYLMMGETGTSTVGTYYSSFNDTEEYLSEEVIAYWTSFISSANPSTYKLSSSPAWTGFNSVTLSRMALTRPGNLTDGSASMVETISSDEIERCRFWMSANVSSQTRV